VLVGVDDVEAGLGEEAADGGDQAGSVGTGEQQARGGVLAVDGGMMAPVPFVRQAGRLTACGSPPDPTA
jgi:hypothetical protein